MKNREKNEKSSYNKKLSLRAILFGSVLFLVLFVLSVFFRQSTFVLIFGLKIQSSAINGVVSVFQIMILVYMTSVDRKRGFVISMFSLVPYCLYLIAIMLKDKKIESIPGLAIILSGMIMVWIVKNNMNQIAKNERELYKLAYMDSLTGLPNRRAFDEHVNELIRSGRQKKFALAVIDLDNFKGINDSVGHECGDGVLCEVARRWSEILTSNDFLARQGGDEFIIVIKDYNSEEQVIQKINRFLDALSSEMVIKTNCFFVSASFGLAFFPFHAENMEKLFRYADMAMYQSKISKTDKIKMFDISMVEPIENEFIYDRLIRGCLSNNSFELVFQPQFQTSQRTLRGFEVLLRMRDDYGRYISPSKFIPYAEKSKLVLDIDRWVLRRSMKIIRPYYDIIGSDFVLSVNISALHLQDESLYDDIAFALQENNFPPRNLEIEITETSLVSSVANATMLLKKIKKLGIGVALDDFGTGFASLSNLSELPIDLLKIDKIFMDKMINDTKYKSFVAAIISIGHIFNFDVISEGVEYEIQLDILRTLRCDYIQGFLWGKPLPIESVEKLLRSIYFPNGIR